LKADLLRIHEDKQHDMCGPASEFVMGYGEAVLSASIKYLEEQLAKTAQVATRKAAE
jgi:hypothetical protein